MSMKKFMLSRVEHDNFFITSGPVLDLHCLPTLSVPTLRVLTVYDHRTPSRYQILRDFIL